MFNLDPTILLATLPAVIVAMVFHEFAHALVATWFGDSTPGDMGRLTINPLAHIDWLGLIMLFFFHFGWAKPVMFNPYQLKHRRLGEACIALAGPLMNFIIAFIAFLVLTIVYDSASYGLLLILRLMIVLNINFGIFNLIPIPPLDGSHVISAFLPKSLEEAYYHFERFSFIILLIFIVSPASDQVLGACSQAVWELFTDASILLGL